MVATTFAAPHASKAVSILAHEGEVRQYALGLIRPVPENDKLYKPVDPNDPQVRRLAENMKLLRKVLEPLVITEDGYLVSGHRRRVAAQLAGFQTVPCRVVPIRREDDIEAFTSLLAAYNLQREKTNDEKLREAIVESDPEQAYQSLIAHRQERSEVPPGESIAIVGTKTRARITEAKKPMMDAIQRVLRERQKFLPLSDRSIHYALLNFPPLIHASKNKKYGNNPESYKALTELLTRARLEGKIPMNAIADETRPVTVWGVFDEVGAYINHELSEFLKGYWRNLMQSQPNHIELLGEKNTLASILKPVAMKYCIPMTTGRGYCSLPPRHGMAQRFRKSGKEKLILLIVSDFDPDGEEIAHSFARSMRDDFDIENIEARKVALTAGIVAKYKLPPDMLAKESSAQYQKFFRKYGKHAYEVEALPPSELQKVLTDAIDSVIDIDAFNAELDAEKADSQSLEGYRRRMREVMGGLSVTDDEGGEP